MSSPANARRDFESLFKDSVPADANPVLLSPTPQSKLLRFKKNNKKKFKVKKSLRVQYHMSTRTIADFLKNPLIAKYGTMKTDPSDIPQATVKSLQKHKNGLCKCQSRGLNCEKQHRRLLNEALNNVKPVFTPWFTEQEIDDYLHYARGEANLGDFRSYHESIEDKAIQCGLFLGLLRPVVNAPAGVFDIKKVRVLNPKVVGYCDYDDENEGDLESELDDSEIDKIIATRGRSIKGHLESEGMDSSGIYKPLKTFDKSLPEPRRYKTKDDQAASWLKDEIARLRPAGPSSALDQAKDALDSLFGAASSQEETSK
jgi:hypothetical protein